MDVASSKFPLARTSALDEDDADLGTHANIVTDFSDTNSIRGRHSHNVSITEPYMPTQEANDMNEHLLSEPEIKVNPLAPPPVPNAEPSDDPSLFRRMTTAIRSKTIKSRFKSIRKPRAVHYDTLEGNDAGDNNVDLSSLAGLGYELQDITNMPSSSRLTDQETTYMSPITETKPSFQSFLSKRRTVGDGLVVGAQIKPDETQLAKSGTIKRANTVRDLGQRLARERGEIVAVSEAIDLSSLEGRTLTHRASQNFETMKLTSGSVEGSPQSYYFPKDPDIPDWRPITMSTVFNLFLAICALGLAILQEYLCVVSIRKAKNNGGLLSYDSVVLISTWDFFAWKYLPTIITIVYAVLFSSMDFDIRRLEPYYRLSQPSGAPASASLNLDLLTMFQYFVPVKAFRLGQWAVGLSTIANIIASTVAPAIQNASVILVTNSNCHQDTLKCPDGQYFYHVRISPIWSYMLSASYAVVAMIAFIILFMLRRKSGLLSDPKGIAGIASMATKSHILQEFSGLDLATRGDIHKRLGHRKFVLYKSSIWQGEWNQNLEPVTESERRLKSPHPVSLRLVAGIPLLVFMSLMLLGVPLISLTALNAIPNGAPWLPIFLATVLKLIFSTFEADVRLMEPFYQLSKGNCRPENGLTLDYQATIYGWMPFKAMLNRHWLVALVGFSSVFLDVFSVTVSSFSVDAHVLLLKHSQGGENANQDESFTSFVVSIVLSITIMVFVIISTSLIYLRRRHPFLPREPSTIASVLAFVYASKMLTDFIDTEQYKHKQMELRLKKIGKTYGLGWFRGRDGRMHCAIDEEPMTSRYIHGKPYTMAVAGPILDHHDSWAV